MALVIRPLEPDRDLDGYLAINNQFSSVSVTADDWWAAQRRTQPGRPNRHLVGERDGRIIAIVFVGDSQMTRNAVVASVVVDRDERGRGHGRALAAAAEAEAAAFQAAVVTTTVRDDDPSSKAWAERRGFIVYDHTFESRLDLEGFDPAVHLWATERAREAGLTIEASVDADRLYELALALFHDVPAVDLDPPPRDLFQRQVVEQDGVFALVARDGDAWAGLAIVTPMADGGAWNWLTGVRPEYRGRGLARALKVAAAEEARRRGGRWLGTGNNAVNAPMLAVNDALGYRRQTGLLWLRRPLDYGAR